MATQKPIPKPGRIDPAPRAVDSFAEWNTVLNKDPNRKYVIVSKSGAMNPDYYDGLGYQVETLRQGGPNLQGGKLNRKMGDRIEHYDQVLMSCDLAVAVAIEQRGQAEADARDAPLYKRGGRDPQRGIGVRNHMGYLPPGLEAGEDHNAPIPSAEE